MQLGLPEAAFAQTPGMGPWSQSREDFSWSRRHGSKLTHGPRGENFCMGTRCSVDQS